MDQVEHPRPTPSTAIRPMIRRFLPLFLCLAGITPGLALGLAGLSWGLPISAIGLMLAVLGASGVLERNLLDLARDAQAASGNSEQFSESILLRRYSFVLGPTSLGFLFALLIAHLDLFAVEAGERGYFLPLTNSDAEPGLQAAYAVFVMTLASAWFGIVLVSHRFAMSLVVAAVAGGCYGGLAKWLGAGSPQPFDAAVVAVFFTLLTQLVYCSFRVIAKSSEASRANECSKPLVSTSPVINDTRTQQSDQSVWTGAYLKALGLLAPVVFGLFLRSAPPQPVPQPVPNTPEAQELFRALHKVVYPPDEQPPQPDRMNQEVE